MKLTHWIVPAILALPACSHESTEDRPSERSAALVQQHDEIWNLMGLSKPARDELDKIVLSVNGQIEHNKAAHPEAIAAAKDVVRAQGEMTHETYVASHKQRFDRLGISAPTQTELLGAADFVWSALHDPSVPAEKRQVAEKIQAMMMKALNGPPPCCDDNIFLRAAK